MATTVYMGMQGRLLEWSTEEGERVTEGDILAEVMGIDNTGKMDVVARVSGVLRKRLVNTGDEGGAETVIAIIGAPEEDISALLGAAASPSSVAAEPAPEVQQVAAIEHVENGTAAAGETREEPAERGTSAEPAPVAAPTQAPVVPPVAVQGMVAGDGGVQASPPAPPREPGVQTAGARSTAGEVPGVREAAEQRREFVDGRAVTPGASSLVHNLIVSNVVGTLFSALRGTACRVVSQAMPVKPARGENVFLPDVAVFCGAAELEPGGLEMLLNPAVLVEVLSPGSTDYDHGKKWESYRRLSSLRDYLLVWHGQARVEWYTRQGTFWMFGEVEGLQAEVPLESIGVALRLAEIYEGILTADVQSD